MGRPGRPAGGQSAHSATRIPGDQRLPARPDLGTADAVCPRHPADGRGAGSPGAGPQVQPALSAGRRHLPGAGGLAAAAAAGLDPAADAVGGAAAGGAQLHAVRAVPVPAREGGQYRARWQCALGPGDPAGSLAGPASG